MRKLFQAMEERLQAGEGLVLVSITASSGAVPRGAGAHMLVGKTGRVCGTIGGGAVEYRCEQIALTVLEEKVSGQREFRLNRRDVQDLGMICGGDVKVFFHYIPAGDRDTIALARQAEVAYRAGQALWLVLNLKMDGALSLYTRQQGFLGSPCPEWLTKYLSRKPEQVEQGEERFCTEQINDGGRVYIFGCGHVSQELEPVLSHVGFRCVVLDDRPEFARRELFPTAEEVGCIDFERIGESLAIGPEDYVCVMTRGHAYDTVIQAQVLPKKPCYVGVIGSRRKAAGVRKALKEDYGIADDLLDRVTTPIGLDIEAETPEEIAISIAAQLIRHRAKLRNA